MKGSRYHCIQRALVGGLFAVGALFGTRCAMAGCENPCDITVEPAQVDPALPACVRIVSGGNGCQCHGFLQIFNNCTDAIEVPDRSVCIQDPACHTVDAGAPMGLVTWMTSTTGDKIWTVHLVTSDGVTHTVTVKGHVSSFGGGCNCYPVMGAAVGSAPLFGLLMFPVVYVGRRRRRRRA